MDTNIIHTIDITIAHLATQETAQEVLSDVLKSAATYIKESELKEATKQIEQDFVASRQHTVPAEGGVTSTITTSTRNTTPSVSAGNASLPVALKTTATAISGGSTSSGGDQSSTTTTTTTGIPATGDGMSNDAASSTTIGTGNQVLPAAVATTSQVYAGSQIQQIIVPQNLQGDTDTKLTLEDVKEYVATRLEEAEDGSETKQYWQMISDSLQTVTSDEGVDIILEKDKKEGYGVGFNLLSDWYMAQSKGTVVEEEKLGHDWEPIRIALIKQIKTYVLTADAQKDAKMKAHWDGIITKLEDATTDIGQLFVDYEELFLVLQQLKDFESLPEKLTIRTKIKVYPDISVSTIYAAIGVKDIYTFLQRFPDETGTGVLKIFINVKGTGTTFGTGDVEFKIKKFGSNGGSKTNINWVIYSASGDIITKYIDHGEVLNHTFSSYGDFIVEAYGGTASAPTLQDAKNSSLARLKTSKRKNYMALTIKEPKLVGVKPSKAAEYVLGEKATIEAQFDVISDSYPSITWNHYIKKPGEKEYGKPVLLSDYTDKRKITDFDFKQKGYHYIEVASGEETFYFGSVEKPIKVGGTYITSIKETLYKKPYFLYNTNHPLLFTPATYKLGKGDDIPEENIHWTILKDGKSTGFRSSGKTLKISKTSDYAEGKYTIKVCVNDPILGKKYAETSIEIIHPQVTVAYWANSKGNKKSMVGLGEVFVRAQINNYPSQDVNLHFMVNGNKIKQTPIKVTTDGNGAINYKIPLTDDLKNKLQLSTTDTSCVQFMIEGIVNKKQYTFKKPAYKLEDVTLSITTKQEIVDAYFRYDNKRVLLSNIIPYCEEIDAIVETPNMIGKEILISVYCKEKNKIICEKAVKVNTDGEAIYPFTLTYDKHALKDGYTFYIGSEENTFWNSFWPDQEFTHNYLKASGKKVEKKSMYNSDHGDWYDPIENPQFRGQYAKWNPHASDYFHSTDKIEGKEHPGIANRSSHEHLGHDIYAPIGTPVRAMFTGEISSYSMTSGSGGFVLKYKSDKAFEDEKKQELGYLHLCNFKSESFIFYGRQEFYYKDYKDGAILNSSIGGVNSMKSKKNAYYIKYNESKKELIIDNVTIDINKAISICGKKRKVTKGEIIGYVGMTGNAREHRSKTHLHINFRGKEMPYYKFYKEYINADSEGENKSKQDGFLPSSTWDNSSGVKNRKGVSSLSTSWKGKLFILDWEKFESKLYNDSKGHCTIGYGHLVHKNNCRLDGKTDEAQFKDGISESKAKELFYSNLKQFEKKIKSEIKVPLSQQEFDAVVSYLYNLGSAPKLFKLLNEKKYDLGVNEISGKNKELEKRREKEQKIFKFGIYDSFH